MSLSNLIQTNLIFQTVWHSKRMLNAWYTDTEEQTGELPQDKTEGLQIKHPDSLPAGLWDMQWANTFLLGMLASPSVSSELSNLHMQIHTLNTQVKGGNACSKYLPIYLNTHHTAALKKKSSLQEIFSKETALQKAQSHTSTYSLYRSATLNHTRLPYCTTHTQCTCFLFLTQSISTEDTLSHLPRR